MHLEKKILKRSITLEEDFQSKWENNVHKLGNLLMLDKEKNSQLGNKIFKEKRDKYPHYFLTQGSKPHDDKKLMNLFEKDKFDFNDIEERTNQLAKIIGEHYKFDFDDDHYDCETNDESNFLYN